MIISELNHFETVAESDVVGAGYSYNPPVSGVNLSAFNTAWVSQYATSFALGGKATANKGSAYANTTAISTNTSVLVQSNNVQDVAIDP
ncbi:hypothetical protein [Kamptonema formosum]|uniref:hypothetical protein n=1 Tax=Kamptonema formosum TaxID=331992 RepID=UPI0003480B22|nr:hypothetical protein [Oscillatoria sp. PCC 10802]